MFFWKCCLLLKPVDHEKLILFAWDSGTDTSAHGMALAYWEWASPKSLVLGELSPELVPGTHKTWGCPVQGVPAMFLENPGDLPISLSW